MLLRQQSEVRPGWSPGRHLRPDSLHGPVSRLLPHTGGPARQQLLTVDHGFIICLVMICLATCKILIVFVNWKTVFNDFKVMQLSHDDLKNVL